MAENQTVEQLANQGVPTPEQEQEARELKAAQEAEQAKKEKESKEAQVRTASDKKEVKTDAKAKVAKADNGTSEDVGSVRTVGWEKEQARIEKAREEEPTPKPKVEKFNGKKLEDRLES